MLGDPNYMLDELHRAIARMDDAQSRANDAADQHNYETSSSLNLAAGIHARSAAEHARYLVQYVEEGGALPDAWQNVDR